MLVDWAVIHKFQLDLKSRLLQKQRERERERDRQRDRQRDRERDRDRGRERERQTDSEYFNLIYFILLFVKCSLVIFFFLLSLNLVFLLEIFLCFCLLQKILLFFFRHISFLHSSFVGWLVGWLDSLFSFNVILLHSWFPSFISVRLFTCSTAFFLSLFLFFIQPVGGAQNTLSLAGEGQDPFTKRSPGYDSKLN